MGHLSVHRECKGKVKIQFFSSGRHKVHHCSSEQRVCLLNTHSSIIDFHVKRSSQSEGRSLFLSPSLSLKLLLLLGGQQRQSCVSRGLHEPWANMKQRSFLGTLGLMKWGTDWEKDCNILWVWFPSWKSSLNMLRDGEPCSFCEATSPIKTLWNWNNYMTINTAYIILAATMFTSTLRAFVGRFSVMKTEDLTCI